MWAKFFTISCAIMHVGCSTGPWWHSQDWDGGLWQTYYHPVESSQNAPFWFPTFLKTIFSPAATQNDLGPDNIQKLPATEEEFIEHYNITDRVTEYECKSDQDCHKINVTLSCMGATPFKLGICMLPLKPMEHGCLFNDQCQKTCVESFCAKEHKYKNSKGENQCRCQKGYYYLWKKCWNNCLPGTAPVHLNDDHWVCHEKNASEARMYFYRNKRQAFRRLVC